MKRNSILHFTPAVGWGIFILYFSLMPGNKVPDLLISVNDKVVHAGIYFVSAVLIYLGFIRYNFTNSITRWKLGIIIVLCLLFGACVELLQHHLIANRTGDWFDFLANVIGTVLGVLLFMSIHRARA